MTSGDVVSYIFDGVLSYKFPYIGYDPPHEK